MTEYLRKKFGNESLYVEYMGFKDRDEHEKIVSDRLNWVNLSFKRGVDLLGAFLFMLFIGWWLFPIVAILIKMDSPGPIFFKQEREGIYNSRFNCYKFRSMVVNKEADFKQATKNDPRITRVGRFLRKSSIDELPQILNVIYGNMSLVGPRPHILVQNEQNAKVIEGYKNRHLVKPGITGLAQAKGHRGETQNPYGMYFRYKLDMHYIKTWHPLMDFRIMGMTVMSILFDNENAH